MVALSAVALFGAASAEAGWIFRPSSFTHDPATGKRVAQFAAKQKAYPQHDPTYRQSVYRHHRSTIRVGESADRMHMVESWGGGDRIRPYGEWERPFREGATPYGPWGNPQGPWTTPFGAWVNPYGLGQLPYPPLWPYGVYRPLPTQPTLPGGLLAQPPDAAYLQGATDEGADD
jgi:hypothetical protein